MSGDVNELTVTYEEDGKVLVQEIDKRVLTKGAWATIIFRYQQWDNKKEDYSPDKYVIRRYRKLNGEYRSQSKFTISSPAQAEKIVAALTEWMEDTAEAE